MDFTFLSLLVAQYGVRWILSNWVFQLELPLWPSLWHSVITWWSLEHAAGLCGFPYLTCKHPQKRSSEQNITLQEKTREKLVFFIILMFPSHHINYITPTKQKQKWERPIENLMSCFFRWIFSSFFWQSVDFVVQVVASRVAVHWDEPPHVPQHAVHEVHVGREGVGLDGLTKKASGGE